MTVTWRDGSTTARTPGDLELACAPNLHAAQHLPGGADEIVNLRVAMRSQVLMTAMGYSQETFDRAVAFQGTAVTSGTVYYIPVGLLTGDVVSNIGVAVNSPGSALTLVKAGLVLPTSTITGSLVASSADVKASFLANGMKSVAMSAAYTVLVNTGAWLAILAIGTTGPAIQRGQLGAQSAALPGAVMGGIATQAGQTDLPVAPALTYSAAANSGLWMEWS